MDMLQRPDWDTYFMNMVYVVAERSTCCRRKVGAVLVKDNRILSTGYNGTPKGLSHCDKAGCLRQQMNIPSGERHEMCRGLHAEQNAIIQAAIYGVSIAGATLYCTTKPCSICTKMLINAEVKKIIYKEHYSDVLADELLKYASIRIINLGENKQ